MQHETIVPHTPVIPVHRLRLRVRSRPYGSYGTAPVHDLECPYFQQHQTASHCVSGTGGVICGGYRGETEGYTLCAWTPRWTMPGQEFVLAPETDLASGAHLPDGMEAR